MRVSKTPSGTIFASEKVFREFIRQQSSCDNYFSIADNPFYGKINSSGDIVYLSEKYLSTLSTKDDKTVYALNFVVDAFKDFKLYYQKAINSNIVKKDGLREAIYPVKGWKSVHELYAYGIQGLYYILINKYLQDPIKTNGAITKNFDDFMKLSTDLFKKFGKNVNLSRSSFLLSRSCPLSTTGLAIEILPDVGDFEIFTSINYDFFLRSLKKFGFMMDINYPKRIVADIGSPAMQKYMDRYGLTMNNLFSNYFYKAKDYDYDLIKIYLIQFYNNYTNDYPILSKVEKAGRVNIEKYYFESVKELGLKKIPFPTQRIACDRSLIDVIKRQKLSQEQLDTLYNDAYWIAYYPQMMNYEMGNPLDKRKIKKVVKNSQNIYKIDGIAAAKGYVNTVFKLLRFPTGGQISIAPRKNTVLTSPSASDTIGPSTTATTSTSGGSTSGGSSGGGY